MATSVLLVDDEEDVRAIFGEELGLAGFEVMTAPSGREALQLVDNRRPDVVVTDIRMADGDGLELLQTLRRRDPHYPVVYLISGFRDCDRDKARALGAADLVTKPFEIADVISMIKSRVGESPAP